MSITTLSSDVTGAVVGVNFGGAPAPCVRANPTVTLSPSQSQGVKTGTAVGGTASATSNDSTSCTAAAFSLAAAVPSGWMAALASPALTIGLGSSGTDVLQVTSTSTARVGSYTIALSATNGQDTAKSGSASATYTIIVATAISVNMTTDQTTHTANQNVKITATVLAGSAAAAGASVTFKVTRGDGSTVSGTATTNATGVASYSLRVEPKDPVGTYQVSGTATPNGATTSGVTSFAVK